MNDEEIAKSIDEVLKILKQESSFIFNLEEIKAIEELNKEISRPVEVPEDKFDTFILYNIENAKILLNLISKLQKENKELTNELKHISKLFGENTKRLETISRKLGLTKKNEYGFLYDEIIKEIDKLQKELEQEKEKNKKLNLENQALFESINCNDDNMLARMYSNLQKENKKLKKQSEISAKTHIKNDDLKDKVIDKMAKTIAGLQLYDFGRKEYFTLEDEGEVREYFYKKVEEENE